MDAQTLLNRMTLRQKCLFLSGQNMWQTWAWPELDLESIFLSDGPHGIRKQMGSGDHLGLAESIPATCFPTAATVANAWDPTLAEEIGQALGREAQALGVQVVLGPGMNLKRNPLCGRNFEYFSEDPYLTGQLASGYVKGIQSQGVAACPKHFAVNSQELRRMSVDSVVDERTLRELYLTAFEQVVKTSQPEFLMTAYNPVNGTYTNEHPDLLQSILKEEWGFDGCIVSDWGGSNDHVAGVQAGSHLEMPSTGLVGALELEAALAEGRLSEETLNQRVLELLSKVLSLLERRHNSLEQEALPADMVAQHHALAQSVAAQSVVLLRNEGAVLPLKEGESLAIVGDFAASPRYQGAGSSLVNPTQLENLVSAGAFYGYGTATYAAGYRRDGQMDQSLLDQAVANASQAETVIFCLGLTEITESEGMDRADFNLPSNQLAVLEAVRQVNPRVIVVLMGGSAVALPFAEEVPAILHAYLGGQAGASALWQVLTGEVSPSGRLAESYPLSYEEVPNAAYYPGLEATSEYREGLYVGYRYYESQPQSQVRYPFGYGLSYSSFSYELVAVKAEEIQVAVTNTGDCAAAEVIQVYAAPRDERGYRPAKELVAFSKVFLEAGERQLVSLTYAPHAFETYHPAEGWVRQAGTYELLVGSHLWAIQLQATIAVEGVTTLPYGSQLEAYREGQVTAIDDETFTALLGRTLPPSRWVAGQLGENDTVSQLYYAKSWLARVVYQVIDRRLAKSMAKGKPDLNLFFTYNITFRGIAKMAHGGVDQAMVKGILEVVNGHFWRGLSHTWRAWRHLKKAGKSHE